MAQRLSEIPDTQLVRLSDVPGGDDDPLVKQMGDIDRRKAERDAAEPGTGEYLLNRAKKGFSGFMGAPGDLVEAFRSTPAGKIHPAFIPLSMMIQQVTGKPTIDPLRDVLPTERVIAGSKTYREALGHDPNMKTSNTGLRYAGGIVEMGAAGGPMALARGVGVLPLTTSSAGAGIGLEAGGDVAEGFGLDRQAGETVGALVGGVGPTLTSSAAGGALDFAKRRFSPSAQRAAAEGSVAQEVAPLATAPASQANLERSLAVSDEFAAAGAEFTPSLPARTASRGLLAMEKDLVTRNPASLEKAVANTQKNEREIAAFVNKQFTGGRETSVQRISQLQKQSAERLEGMRKAVDDKLDDLATRFEQQPDNFALGNQVRDLVFKQKEVYKGISAQKYQDTYKAADRLGVTADISDIQQYADDILKSDFNAYQASEIPPVFRQLAKGAGVPDYVKAFISQHGGQAEGTVSFAKLHSLYKRANSDIASMRGSTAVDKDFKLHLLNEVKTRLQQKLAAFEDAGFGEVATKLKDANAFYMTEYLPRFKQGFGADVLARYSSGEFRIPNQEVVRQITTANNAQAARDFKLLFDEVPEAWEALRGGYMDKLAREVNVIGQNGRIDQKKLDGFLRKHSQTLNEFPQIRNEFKQLALDNQALLDRNAAVAAQQKERAASALFKLINGKTPEEVIPEAVKNANGMRVLVHKARVIPEEANALARAIAEDVVRQPDPVAYFAKNRASIELGLKALGPGHMKNLETALEAITINQRSQLPGFVQRSGVAPDAIAEKVGSSPRAIISHILNAERGRTGYVQEGSAFLGRWFDKLRRDHKAVAMEAVFYDPDAARAIASLAKQPQSEKFRLDFVNAMATLGLRAEIAGQE